MRSFTTLISMAIVITPSVLYAAETELSVADQTIIIGAKPSTEGKGYSIYSYIKGEAKPLCVSITLTCGDGSRDSKCCPTVNYSTHCPNAKITCN